MKKQKILVVDDDAAISRLLYANFSVRGYEVTSAMDGQAALDKLNEEFFDLIVLDIMMPRLNGFEVCRKVREWSQIPIIMLSAKGDERDKIACLEIGADDYITKPFSIDELLARVKTALRHAGASEQASRNPVLNFGELEINMPGRRVLLSGKEIKLSPIEYRLLQELALNANKVLTHQLLLQKIWGMEYSDEREYLRVFINRLRRKLDDNDSKFIVTVPRIGYQMFYREPSPVEVCIN